MAKIHNNDIFDSINKNCKLKTTDNVEPELLPVLNPVLNVLPKLQIKTTTDLDSGGTMLTTRTDADTYLRFIWVAITSADTVNHSDNGSISFYDWLGTQRHCYGAYGSNTFIDFGDRGILLKRGTNIDTGGLGAGGFTYYEIED